MYAVRLFIYFPEYEVIGHTTAGTPYTWASNVQCINWYEIHVPGQEQPWHYDITECAMSFAIFVNNDGQYIPEDYFMVYVLYPLQQVKQYGNKTMNMLYIGRRVVFSAI